MWNFRTYNSNWSPTLTFAVFGSTLGTAFPLGYVAGSLNSPTTFIQTWCNETIISRYGVHLSEGQLLFLWSSVVSIYAIGGILASIMVGPMANKFGRRFNFYVCGFLLAISAACFFFCRKLSLVELLFCGRFGSGLAYGINMSNLPIYHSELALKKQHGTLGTICGVGVALGIVVGQIFTLESLLGTEEHWHIALSIFIVPVVVCYIPFQLYPESPKWLYVIAGNKDAAEMELKRFCGDHKSHNIAEEMELLEIEANQKTDIRLSYAQVLRDPKLHLPLFILCASLWCQRFSGINVIYYYSVFIFRKAGLSQQLASQVNVGIGLITLSMAVFNIYGMRRFRRRPLMMISTLSCSVCLCLFGLLLKYMDLADWFSNALIACMLLFIFCYNVGFGAIPFFIGTELFEVAPRSVAMSLSSITHNVGNILLNTSFLTIEKYLGGFVFVAFSLHCFLLFLLTMYYLPETKGRTPTEVSKIVANGFKSKVRSSGVKR